MHETHSGCTKNLSAAEKAVCFSAVHGPANHRYNLAYNPTEYKAKDKAQNKTVNHLCPFCHIDASCTVLDGNRSAGKSRNQAVALTGGNPKIRRAHAIHHNREQRRTQGNQRFMGIAAEIHHIADSRSHRTVDLGHNQHPQKIKGGAHKYSVPNAHTACCHTGGDGIGGVCPPIHKNNAQGK